MRYVLKIAYDGTAYAGWQRQKNAPSVQERLENAVQAALGEEVRITGSGRTDAGVHAAGQVCHFDSDTLTVPPEKLPDCLNRYLPPDIRAIIQDHDRGVIMGTRSYGKGLVQSIRPLPYNGQTHRMG